MANKLKNEVSVDLASRNILLRPTFGCLIEIEGRTGKSIMQICEDISNAKLTLTDTIVIYEEATKAADKPLTRQEVIDLMEEVGVVAMQTATHEFFSKALYPGEAQSKKKSVKVVEATK